MSLDNTRLIARGAAQQAVSEAKLLAPKDGLFFGSTTDTTPTVIGSIAVTPYSAGIIRAMVSGLDDSRNAYHIAKAMTFKHDGSTLTIPDTASEYAPTGEVTASVSFVVNGDSIDVTVTGTGGMNWKVSYWLNSVVNDAGLA